VTGAVGGTPGHLAETAPSGAEVSSRTPRTPVQPTHGRSWSGWSGARRHSAGPGGSGCSGGGGRMPTSSGGDGGRMPTSSGISKKTRFCIHTHLNAPCSGVCIWSASCASHESSFQLQKPKWTCKCCPLGLKIHLCLRNC